MPHHQRQQLNWGEMSIDDVISLAIEDEEEARDYYRHAADLAGTSHTREVLLRLSAMEQGHADELRRELEELHLQREMEAGMAD